MSADSVLKCQNCGKDFKKAIPMSIDKELHCPYCGSIEFDYQYTLVYENGICDA